jgi:hypothetical protein
MSKARPTPEDLHAFARDIVLDHAKDVEFLSVTEMLEDDLYEYDEDAQAEICREVHDLIRKASVTVSWPSVSVEETPQ